MVVNHERERAIESPLKRLLQKRFYKKTGKEGPSRADKE